ncbi:MAG: amidohydrolase [Acidobacteriia bacterium]|nr:amidohydrolase [Terriglobia bacterium]
MRIDRLVGKLLAPTLLSASLLSAQNNADLVLIHGKILTVDARDSIAEALAVRDGKILATGSSQAMLARADEHARVIDLHGLTVTPGLIDSHAHFTETNTLYELNFADSHTVDDVIARVKEKADSLKPGEWIRGEQWDESKLKERRYVTAADLDKAAPNNPVWLTQSTGHYGVADSYALKLAHITRETKDPPAGTIDRDAQGNPSGVLKEGAAMGLVTRLIPPFTRDQNIQGILKIMADFNREGMTAAKDPAIRQSKWDLYQDLLRENKLTVRVFTLWLGGRSMESGRQTMAALSKLPKPPQSFGDGMLIAGGIKMYIDGSGGGRTGWLYKDWNKESTGTDTGNAGYPVVEPDVYRQMVEMFHNAGLHVGTHAVGDRGIDWVVDTYAEALKRNPIHGLRHSIIHSNLPTDHAMDVMADLQKRYDAGYPEAQAEFMWWIGDTYAGNYGPERAARLLPFKTFVAKGIQWGGGSDFPVTPLAARYGLWASVVRQTLDGVYGSHPFGTSQSIDIHTALRSYTIWSAYQLFMEKRIGSIEAGKEADFAVWDRDMYTIPSDDLRNLKCEMTILHGKIVYQSSTSPLSVATKPAR